MTVEHTRRSLVILAALCGGVACAGSPPHADRVRQVEIAVPAEPAYSSADSLLSLLNTPETFDVLRKHIPYFVNLTEHGLIPAFSTEMTLDDLLRVPEAKATPDVIEAINRELAQIPFRR